MDLKQCPTEQRYNNNVALAAVHADRRTDTLWRAARDGKTLGVRRGRGWGPEIDMQRQQGINEQRAVTHCLGWRCCVVDSIVVLGCWGGGQGGGGRGGGRGGGLPSLSSPINRFVAAACRGRSAPDSRARARGPFDHKNFNQILARSVRQAIMIEHQT
jgi:hypothetical protein